MSKIKKVAVIGTGVIGVGWTIRFLAHNIKVLAYDKNLIQRNILSIKKFKIKLTRYLNNKPSTENKIKRKGRTIM